MLRSRQLSEGAGRNAAAHPKNSGLAMSVDDYCEQRANVGEGHLQAKCRPRACLDGAEDYWGRKCGA